MNELTLHAPRNLEGSHIATITRVEELTKSRARITFELKTNPPAIVRRNYPLSLHPRSALYALLSGLKIVNALHVSGPFAIKGEPGAVELARLVGVKARVQVRRKIVATRNTVVSATRLRK